MHDTRLNLLGSKKGEEHVESNLDSIDENKTVLGRDEFKVNSMNERPNLPRSLHGSEQIVLDLVSNHVEGVTIDETEVGEEDAHEDGAPADLVDGYLGGNGYSVSSLDFGVEPVVKVVAGGSVVDESEDGEGYETLDVECSLDDEELSKKISEEETNSRSACLSSDRVGIKSLIVCSPSRNSSSSYFLVTEKRGYGGRSLGSEVIGYKRRVGLLHEGRGALDSECLGGEAGCSKEYRDELHCDL